MGELPSAKELGSRADGTDHVVLHISKSIRGFNKAALIKKLQRELPEHSVFASGTDAESHWVTIKQVIESVVISREEAAFRAAVADYQSICTVLVEAHKTRRLRGGWTASSHGEHIRFENPQTGQVVEAPAEGGDDTSPDPGFLWEYLSTTPEFLELAKLLPGGFHDCARMLETLDL